MKNGFRHFGIRVRVMFIAILPITFLLSAIVLYTYYSRLAEVRVELAEHGMMVATALAQSSDYGIGSGNLSDVERITKSLVQADTSIYNISILDGKKREKLHVNSSHTRDAEGHFIEVPIRRQLLALDSFSDERMPNISSLRDAPGQTKYQTEGDIIGYVRVTISPYDLMQKQKSRIYVQSGMVLATFSASVLFALWLARSLTKPMTLAIKALRAIRESDYEQRIEVTTGGEIGELQATINEMARHLAQSKRNLENKIRERTRELELSNAEKRRLIHKVNSIVEFERKNIAVEIHDELNATLIGVRLNSKRIADLAVNTEPCLARDEIVERAKATITLAAALYASARNIVKKLRPEVLDMLGLQGAVEEMLLNYNESCQNCRFEFNSAGDFSKLEDGIAIAAYRLIQEALSNVIKHAAASKVFVSLLTEDKENILHISITDNGVGFDSSANPRGIGIVGMRERVYAFNGEMEIMSEIGIGTTIAIQLPLSTAAISKE